MSSSVDIANKERDILIQGKSLIEGSDDATLTAESQYSFPFSRSNRKFCLSLHYNGRNRAISIQSNRF